MWLISFHHYTAQLLFIHLHLKIYTFPDWCETQGTIINMCMHHLKDWWSITCINQYDKKSYCAADDSHHQISNNIAAATCYMFYSLSLYTSVLQFCKNPKQKLHSTTCSNALQFINTPGGINCYKNMATAWATNMLNPINHACHTYDDLIIFNRHICQLSSDWQEGFYSVWLHFENKKRPKRPDKQRRRSLNMTDTLSLYDDMYASLEDITVLAGVTVSIPVRHLKALHLLLSSETMIGKTFLIYLLS